MESWDPDAPMNKTALDASLDVSKTMVSQYHSFGKL